MREPVRCCHAWSLLLHKMDEYDKVYFYLESGTCTYPEGLSKDGYIMTWVDFYLSLMQPMGNCFPLLMSGDQFEY